MKWVREGKKFWFIEPLDSEIRAIEIPGQDPDPVYPNSKWAQYLSLIYSLIGGLWGRVVEWVQVPDDKVRVQGYADG